MRDYAHYGEQVDGSGRVALYVPQDWFDLLADGGDPETVERRFRELIDSSYPHENSQVRRDFIEALLYWRTSMLHRGMISQGIITVPEDVENGPATWQISTGVVEVPPTSADINLTALMERQLGSRLHDREVFLESFPTEMGLGFGVISQPEFSRNGRFDAFPPLRDPSTLATHKSEQVRIGLAVVLATPPEGGLGLLVMGYFLDPEQVLPLAAVVATIGGNSYFVEGLDPDEKM
ncbi:hypothetical protein O7599_18045 [Streptomyces sp. WMMC500]|uniref:hypothetical protein n=1 Tax=Streptomyces sp. WMMC500 TaxID=3015154 RepID=UPI00248AC2C6|nr:hypothetical protein [Streptomyces sp. WMMC500]WBB64293.1 hypothetical protein O7599_18045 [Streptomyces sp. WMMC500]